MGADFCHFAPIILFKDLDNCSAIHGVYLYTFIAEHVKVKKSADNISFEKDAHSATLHSHLSSWAFCVKIKSELALELNWVYY